MPASSIVLVCCGVGTLVLGVTHFYYPALFSYRMIFDAYPHRDQELKPFRLWFIRYPMDIDKAHAIVWMMNHHVSLVLTSIGVVEIVKSGWLLAEARYLLLWFAGWWALRALCQPFLLGRRWYDWMIMAGFGLLAVIHLSIGLS